MTTQTHFEERPLVGEKDIPGICDLINTCNVVDQLADEPYAGEAFTHRWLLENPDRRPARTTWWTPTSTSASIPTHGTRGWKPPLSAGPATGYGASRKRKGTRPVSNRACTRPRRNILPTGGPPWRRWASRRSATSTR